MSLDDGASWEDVSSYGVAPGYRGMLSNDVNHPLRFRWAYGRYNASWPGTDVVSLDFGMALAGETVRLADI